MLEMNTLRFDQDGLIPGVVQAPSGEVRMVGYLSAEALEKTQATGFVTFWSRSRQDLWTKGETSGNRLKLVEIRADCDGDCLLIIADPEGPTCHRGTDTCFDSTGRALAKCLPYHVFAQMKGKNTYSGKFLKQVQQHYDAFLPAGYTQPADKVVFYTFRIDPAGLVRDVRILTDAPEELQAAILKAVNQLPPFMPATLEGSPTNDVVEWMLTAKAVKR